MKYQINPRQFVFDKIEQIDKEKNKQHKAFNWYVLDFNSGRLNLFDVVPMIKRDLKGRCVDINIHNFDSFAKEIGASVMYLFHGRSQFEQCITCSLPCVDKEEIDRLVQARKKSPEQYRYNVNLSWDVEMDVAFQILSNWDAFISYMWSHKKELEQCDDED